MFLNRLVGAGERHVKAACSCLRQGPVLDDGNESASSQAAAAATAAASVAAAVMAAEVKAWRCLTTPQTHPN
eukprot:4358518-Amphidinium_carterae.1